MVVGHNSQFDMGCTADAIVGDGSRSYDLNY